MLSDFVLLLLGGAALYYGAEWLVRGAAGLALAFGVPPLVVGLTVVAYGTSAPELAVGGLAALDGRGAIAIGNVVGSNIANLGLILGSTALLSPPDVEASLIRREIPVLVLSAIAIPLVLMDGVIGRIDGLLLLGAGVAFTVWVLRSTWHGARPPVDDENEEETLTQGRLAGLVVVGLIVLVAGGKFFVDGAVAIALALGVSERIVGLTVVAVGTSLPELAASVVATLRGHSALAVGNVVGSNILNSFVVLGGAALIHPFDGDLSTMTLDIAVLCAMTLLGAVLLRGPRKVARIEGGVLLAGYAAFIAAIVLS